MGSRVVRTDEPFCDLYLRKSEADSEEALLAHEAECRALAGRLGIPIRHVIKEIISATKPLERKGFERLLADTPPVIICWHQDRLIRTIDDLERVIKTDSAVHSVQAAVLDLSTPTGRAVARTVTAWSQFEGEHRKERQAIELNRMRAEGLRTGGRRPMGYVIDKTVPGGLRIDKAEARALIKGYKLLLAGKSPADIARAWNTAGLTSTQAGRAWLPSEVADVLRNPTLAGLRTYKEVVIGNAAWPGLVDRASWEAAAAILNDPSRRINRGATRSSLLAGIAVCAVDGAHLHAGGSAASVLRYECSAGRHLSVGRADVDLHVLTEIGKTLDWWVDPAHQPFPEVALDPGLTRELTALESRLDGLAGDLALSERVLAQRTAAIEARIAEIGRLVAEQVAQPRRAPLDELLGVREGEARRTAWWRAKPAIQRQVIERGFVVTVTPPGRGTKAFRPDTVTVTPRQP